MTRSRRQYGSQRAEFVRGHDSEPDVTLSNVTIGRQTDRAVLVTVKDHPEPIWIPLSQITNMVRAGPGVAGQDSIVISAWIAKQKGIA